MSSKQPRHRAFFLIFYNWKARRQGEGQYEVVFTPRMSS